MSPGQRPHVGDIVQTPDGHLHRVTRVHDHTDPNRRVVALSRCGDHTEMAARWDQIEIREPHPGGPR